MRQQHALYLGRGDLKPPHLDHLLFAVDNVPQFRAAVAVHDVPRVEEAVGVESLGVGRRVVEVLLDHRGPLDAQFPRDVVTGNVFALVVDQFHVDAGPHPTHRPRHVVLRVVEPGEDASALGHAHDLGEGRVGPHVFPDPRLGFLAQRRRAGQRLSDRLQRVPFDEGGHADGHGHGRDDVQFGHLVFFQVRQERLQFETAHDVRPLAVLERRRVHARADGGVEHGRGEEVDNLIGSFGTGDPIDQFVLGYQVEVRGHGRLGEARRSGTRQTSRRGVCARLRVVESYPIRLSVPQEVVPTQKPVRTGLTGLGVEDADTGDRDSGPLRGLQQRREQLRFANEEFGLGDLDVVLKFEWGVSRIRPREDGPGPDDGQHEEGVVDVVERVHNDTIPPPHAHVTKSRYQFADGRTGVEV